MQDGWDDSDETTGVYDPSSSSPPSNERWFMSPDGRTKQQFTAAEIIQQCQAGTIDDSTLVWREGLPDWAPLAEVPELARALRVFSRAPAVPGASPTASSHQRPSLPTLPPTPSLPPRAPSTTPPGSFGHRLSQRVTNLVIDERNARPLGGGRPSHRVGERPLSLLDLEEPYSLLLPGGRRVGVWSLAAAGSVFAAFCIVGVLVFGASDDASEAFEDAEPVLVNLDTPTSPSAARVTSGSDDDDAPSVEETTDPPLNEEGDDKASAKAEGDGPKKLESKIDRDAVTKALSAAAKAAAECSPSGKAKGSGKVKVVFEPNGRVSRVSLLSPEFEGTQTGGCVALAFRNVKVPPYEGGRVSAVKSFKVE